MRGDAELNLAHYALQKLHIMPHELDELSYREKVFVFASIGLRIDAEAREAAKIKNKAR